MTDPKHHPLPRPVPGVYRRVLWHALWPWMNRLNGTEIHLRQRELERSQWLDRGALEAIQLEKLQRLLARAHERVPHYRRSLDEAGLRPSQLSSLEDLRRLPTVTKAMLKSRPRRLPRPRRALPGAGVGHDQRLHGAAHALSYRSHAQESMHWALKYRMWGMAGYQLGDPYVHVYGMARPGWKKRLQDRLLRNKAVFVFGEADQASQLDGVLEVLSRKRVRFLAGCSTTLKILAEHLKATDRSFRGDLSALLTTGSVLTGEDRSSMERAFGAAVWDHYGLGGEGAHVAAECEEKHGYHVNVENLVLEPADPEAARRGEPSEILVTVLDNLAWPLIRYASGDHAVFTERTCPCGRGLPLLERIDGRISEVLSLPNGSRVNVHYFSVVMGKHAGVLQYQVEQVAEDRLRFTVVWESPDRSAETETQIREELAKVSAGTVDVEFESVAEIPLPASGKHRYVIPLRAA